MRLSSSHKPLVLQRSVTFKVHQGYNYNYQEFEHTVLVRMEDICFIKFQVWNK
ncbi:hypothetical protein LX87_04766 [Larkinella arboricola]|uniref:Uncharacterized protein n=1 Tax=Larkinella arboricola TaxID=643671 RepID=A0A327WNZ8_LARAB|nr:hypothetical protein LX87_04766 [Larkinella arboricola]